MSAQQNENKARKLEWIGVFLGCVLLAIFAGNVIPDVVGVSPIEAVYDARTTPTIRTPQGGTAEIVRNKDGSTTLFTRDSIALTDAVVLAAMASPEFQKIFPGSGPIQSIEIDSTGHIVESQAELRSRR